MVQPPFPFSTHPWLPLTPSASTPLQLQSILVELMQLHHTHSQTNCRSILDPFGPSSHAKGHHLYTVFDHSMISCFGQSSPQPLPLTLDNLKDHKCACI